MSNDRRARWGAAGAVVAIAAALGAGCGQTDVAPSELLRSAADRDLSPAVDVATQQALVGGDTAFALDMYRALDEREEGNLFFSPLSISLALAMVYAGARGETETQMAETLHFDLAQELLHPALNWLALELEGRGARGGFELSIASSIWGQRDYAFEESYLDLLGVNYGAGLRVVDFGADPEAARAAINDWVEGETNGRIEDLMPAGTVSSLTRLVLANAIYFHASWRDQFDPDLTSDGTFRLLDGGAATVPFMHQEVDLPYAEGEGYQAVELPYEGEEVSMVVLLPEAGTFEAFEGSLDAASLDGILDALAPGEVILTLPRFEFDDDLNLAETLEALGMTDAFAPGTADFTGIEPTGELFISAVVHKAFVAVNEEGTEAAAATGVAMSGTAEPMGSIFTADRPFLFLIRDEATGSILFVGRLLDPR